MNEFPLPAKEPKNPKVGILCPTYNRHQWLPLFKQNIISQTYPHDKIEVFILDDGDVPFIEELEELQKEVSPIIIHYKKSCAKGNRLSIGAKRNVLCKLALQVLGKKGIVCNMDDDDFFCPSYVEYSIRELQSDCRLQVVGSNAMFFMYPYDEWKMTAIQCGMKRQIHESCLTMKLSHWKQMGGYDKSSRGEGSKLFDGVNQECIKIIDIRFLMVCIAHQNNTIDKEQFNNKDNQLNMKFNLEPYVEIISKILNL